jgi:hypothetical protein
MYSKIYHSEGSALAHLKDPDPPQNIQTCTVSPHMDFNKLVIHFLSTDEHQKADCGIAIGHRHLDTVMN